MPALTRVHLLLLSGALLSGCAPAVVGDWRSANVHDNGLRNLMRLTDGGGEATIYATSAKDRSIWVSFSFEVTWQDSDDELSLEMACKDGPCSGDDFAMDCNEVETNSGTDGLQCRGDGHWANYPFIWERADD